MIKLFFRERVETFTGVLDHDNAHEGGQYALIKFNPREHVMDQLSRILFKRYVDSRVYHHTGIPWDRFYRELEYWETEDIIEQCQELSKRDSQEAESLQNEIRNANADASKRNKAVR